MCLFGCTAVRPVHIVGVREAIYHANALQRGSMARPNIPQRLSRAADSTGGARSAGSTGAACDAAAGQRSSWAAVGVGAPSGRQGTLDDGVTSDYQILCLPNIAPSGLAIRLSHAGTVIWKGKFSKNRCMFCALHSRVGNRGLPTGTTHEDRI
jgi:hypothetical protein